MTFPLSSSSSGDVTAPLMSVHDAADAETGEVPASADTEDMTEVATMLDTESCAAQAAETVGLCPGPRIPGLLRRFLTSSESDGEATQADDNEDMSPADVEAMMPPGYRVSDDTPRKRWRCIFGSWRAADYATKSRTYRWAGRRRSALLLVKWAWAHNDRLALLQADVSRQEHGQGQD